MRYRVMYLSCILLAAGGLAHSVAADTSRERVALSLSGPDCSSQRLSIVTALAQMRDVGHVDLESVPDHALVDIISGDVTPEALSAAATRGLTSGAQCHIEIMKSCISASLFPAGR